MKIKFPQLDVEALEITPDGVLRGQGADGGIIKKRRPDLYDLAAEALQEGLALLSPEYLVEEVAVKEVRHENILLENGQKISGALISQHLSSSESIFTVLCTVGNSLENYAMKVSDGDMVKGLALYGVGSAAVEALANKICNQIESVALAEGLRATIPLSPGMIGWPIDQGQPEIFEILDAHKIGVELTSHYLMRPTKSLSMLIGVGKNVDTGGSTCDFCAMKEICRYQDHYRHVEQ